MDLCNFHRAQDFHAVVTTANYILLEKLYKCITLTSQEKRICVLFNLPIKINTYICTHVMEHHIYMCSALAQMSMNSFHIVCIKPGACAHLSV